MSCVNKQPVVNRLYLLPAGGNHIFWLIVSWLVLYQSNGLSGLINSKGPIIKACSIYSQIKEGKNLNLER